jgi:hypothetical protein
MFLFRVRRPLPARIAEKTQKWHFDTGANTGRFSEITPASKKMPLGFHRQKSLQHRFIFRDA